MTPEFFVLHKDLPREGPGEAADIAWACAVAGVSSDARIADLGCGPGGDIAAFLQAAPEGHVTAIDAHAPFVAQAQRQFGADPRVTCRVGDMAVPGGPYDLVWCAGAAYFLGVNAALSAWRPALAAGGAVAFSEPCFFTASPSPGARAFWEGHETTTEAGIADKVQSAGYRVLGTRQLNDAAWEAYYGPLEARVAALRPGADAALTTVLDEAMAEIAGWRAHRQETGYLLVVARPA